MAGKKISELTEVLSVDIDNDYVVISRSGNNKKLKVANMMGSTNVGDNYIDLTSYEDNKNYRLIVEPLSDTLDDDSLRKCKKINLKGVADYHDGKCEWLIP